MSKNKKEMSRAEQKRKERDAKRKKSTTESDGTTSTWDTIRWVIGLFILLFSLYVLVAAVAHLFVWRNDLGVLANNPLNTVSVYNNVCGKTGAILANYLVGQSFGIFGVLLPIIGILFGGFLLLKHSRVLWRTALSIVLVAICGSLSLAFATGADGFFGTGWGGAYGITIVNMLDERIGGMGVFFVLVACWIVTGIIINLHFIDFLRRTTESGVEQGKDALLSLKGYIAQKREQRKESKRTKIDDAVKEENQVRVIGGENIPQNEPMLEKPAAEEEPVVEPEAIVEEPTENVEPEVELQPAEESGRTSNIDSVTVLEHTPGLCSTDDVNNHRPFDPDSTPKYEFHAAGNYRIAAIPLTELPAEGAHNITVTETIVMAMSPSMLNYSEGYLWVGNFYYPKGKYDLSPNMPFTTVASERGDQTPKSFPALS